VIVKKLIATWKKLGTVACVMLIVCVVAAIGAAFMRGPYLLVNVITAGCMLSLVAMGLALVFGVMNIGMFAHGEMFMIGTLVAYYTVSPFQNLLYEDHPGKMVYLAPILAIVGATVAGFIIGCLVEILLFKPLRKRTKANWVMNSFLLTVGLGIILVNGHQILFAANYKGITKYLPGAPVDILGVYVSPDRLGAVIISVIVVVAFWQFMTRTRLGTAVRAVSQDETGALMVGIDLPLIFTLTMALSCSMAAVAGATLHFMYPSYPTVGLEPTYLSWFVVILVGLGNTTGAMIGAFMVALFKVLTIEFVGSGWDNVVPTALIMLILIFKPSGIFGSAVRSKVDQ
jgi:branched-chain amino acid transport system permease protein